MTELYSRRSFLAGVLTSGTLSAGAGYVLTRREPVDLVLATGNDPTGGRQLLVTMWNQLNPDVQIHTETVNSSTRDQYELFLRTKADIFNLDVIHIPRFADDERIVPITPLDGNPPLAAVSRLSQRAGRDDFWAIPFNTDVGMLYRRIADKRVADPEPKLADLLTTAPGQFAGQLDTVGPQTEEAFVVNVLEQALAQDDAILTEDGVLSFSLGQWRQALGPVAAAIKAGRVLDQAGEGSTTRVFQQSGLRYMRNWPVSFPAVERAERTKVSTAEIRLGGLPTGIIGGQSLAVSADSPHREEAEAAIRFLTGKSAQLLLTKYGFAPTGLDAYINQRLAESLPHLQDIRVAVESSRPRPMHKNYAAFARVFAEHTRALLQDGEQLTQRFISDIQQELG
ncbi:extracellular solute-binding protein [Paractinoplanes lichenicola]|uniref:Extracellular solute-binding protein n=1 Tax=Paractinoplanes lichenicola TaxID=2802976 RepID=A0ABS1VNG6_9ACTN|nr:extracellular solute-binding protein [Actinoplanes lichenicola]MBL7256270.1 extracellular solute-binding protein [Actinoplanes lichenicola]